MSNRPGAIGAGIPEALVVANIFKKGDVVVLKSGGPPMTIDSLPGEEKFGANRGEYLCKWFKGATAEKGGYNEHLLQIYTPPVKK